MVEFGRLPLRGTRPSAQTLRVSAPVLWRIPTRSRA